jgi:hypothetical protein
MNIDLTAATNFMATHARLLDRRRFEGDRSGALAALDGYRNDDGGYGWGLEPDLRAHESQPGSAHHAFEVFAEAGPATSPHAASLCDWLDSASLDDGGLPMALPLSTTAGSAPWWASADSSVSSLQITAVAAAEAHRVAVHDPAVAGHRWLERATSYCIDAIERMDEAPFAYVLEFSIRFLDALHDSRPAEAESLLDRLRPYVPADGKVPVTGGTEGETLNALDIAPYPGRLARTLFADEVIAADLERLAGLQQEDGGWVVDYQPISPQGALDWRGYATVRAVDILQRGGR